MTEELPVRSVDRRRGDGCKLVGPIRLAEWVMWDVVVLEDSQEVQERLFGWQAAGYEVRDHAGWRVRQVAGCFGAGVAGLDELLWRW